MRLVEVVGFPNPFKQSVVDVDGVVVVGILFSGVTVLQVTMTAGVVCLVAGGWVLVVLQGGYEQGVVVFLKDLGVDVLDVVELQTEIFLVVVEAIVLVAPVFVGVAVPLAFSDGVNVEGHGRDVQGLVVVDAVVEDLEQFLMCLRVL